MDVVIVGSHFYKKKRNTDHMIRKLDSVATLSSLGGSDIRPRTFLSTEDVAIVLQNLDHTMLKCSRRSCKRWKRRVYKSSVSPIQCSRKISIPVVSVLSDESKRLRGGFADIRGFCGTDLSRLKFS